MLIHDAKQLVREWVDAEASRLPGFAGAYFAGSAMWRRDDEELPAASDVDVWFVLGDDAPASKLGKFAYRGVLLDVSYTTFGQLGSADELLADHQRAGAFRRPNVIADPTGRLTALQAAVERDFARRTRVEQRCDRAAQHCLRYVRALEPSMPFPDAVLVWAFACGVMSHVLLVAGLRNPTVRLRYLAARQLLAEYDRLDFYETLLEPLGCAPLTPEHARRHTDTLAGAFDDASRVLTTPVFFAGDISADARHVAIDGAEALIDRGDHREAVFWNVVTYARCMKVLAADAPALHDRHDPGFREMLGDLGVTSSVDLEGRAARVEALLPDVTDLATAIVDANTEIRP